MFELDMYRLLPENNFLEIDMNECMQNPYMQNPCMQNPYRIFVLETRLYPLIYKMFNNISIYPKSKYNVVKNRLDIYLRIVHNEPAIYELTNETDDIEIEMSHQEREIIQNKINEIYTVHVNYALISIDELYSISSKKFPISYLENMIEYTFNDFSSLTSNNLKNLNNSNNSKNTNNSKPLNNLNKNSFLDNQRIVANLDAFVQAEGVYIRFDSKTDYKSYYRNICEMILKNTDYFYETGIIKTSDKNLVAAWNLSNIVTDTVKDSVIDNVKDSVIDNVIDNVNVNENVNKLYYPNWTNRIYCSNKTDFLYERIYGDNFLYFNMSNRLSFHLVISALQKNSFNAYICNNQLKVECDNYTQAEKISEFIYNIDSGYVFTIITQNLNEIYLFLSYSKSKFPNSDAIYYIDDSDYVFSCKFNDSLLDFDKLSSDFKNYATQKLLYSTQLKSK